MTAFGINAGPGALVGRVVQNSVAAPRVTFRAAPDDPLVKSGLNASNSFRATIFPLSRWREVPVSGTWMQVLASQNGRATYDLPLLSLRGATTRLAQLSVNVRVHQGGAARLSNNYGLSPPARAVARVMSLSQKNYRVIRDLRVNIAGLTDALLVTPNVGKSGGIFALAVTDSAMLVPKNTPVTSDLGALGARARAGETRLFTGTYAGENPAAAALWATERINAVGKSSAQRAEVIALSTRYGVASPYTSWLTVSDEDARFYRRALVDAQLDPLVREYWLRVADGREKSARAVELQKSIALISRGNGLNPQSARRTLHASGQRRQSRGVAGLVLRPNAEHCGPKTLRALER